MQIDHLAQGVDNFPFLILEVISASAVSQWMPEDLQTVLQKKPASGQSGLVWAMLILVRRGWVERTFDLDPDELGERVVGRRLGAARASPARPARRPAEPGASYNFSDTIMPRIQFCSVLEETKKL